MIRAWPVMEDLVLIVPHVNLRRSLTIIMSVLPVKAMELIYPPKIKHVFPATHQAILSILDNVSIVIHPAWLAMESQIQTAPPVQHRRSLIATTHVSLAQVMEHTFTLKINRVLTATNRDTLEYQVNV